MFNFLKSALGIGSKVAPKIAQGVRSAITGLTRTTPASTAPIRAASQQLDLTSTFVKAAGETARKQAARETLAARKQNLITAAERKFDIQAAGKQAELNATRLGNLATSRPITSAVRETVEAIPTGPLPGQLPLPFLPTLTRAQQAKTAAAGLGKDIKAAYTPRFKLKPAGRAEDIAGMSERAASIYKKRPFISAAIGVPTTAAMTAADVPGKIESLTSGLPEPIQPFVNAGLTSAAYALPFGAARLAGAPKVGLRNILAGLGIGTAVGGTFGLLNPPTEELPAEQVPATVPGSAPSLDITQEDVDVAVQSEADLIDQAYNEAINKIIAASQAGVPNDYLQTQLAAIEQERAAAEAQLQIAYDAATQQVTSNTEQMNQLLNDFARQAMAEYQATAGNIPMAGIPGLTGEQAGMAGVSSTALGGAGITGMSEANALAAAGNQGNLANILAANISSQDILNQLAQERAAGQAGLAGNVAEAQAAARLADVERRAEAAQSLQLGMADVELARAQALARLAESGKSKTVYKPAKQPTWYNTRLPGNATDIVGASSLTVGQANNILSDMDGAIASGDFGGATPREFWAEWFTNATKSAGNYPSLVALLEAAGRPATVDGMVAAVYNK